MHVAMLSGAVWQKIVCTLDHAGTTYTRRSRAIFLLPSICGGLSVEQCISGALSSFSTYRIMCSTDVKGGKWMQVVLSVVAWPPP